MILNGEFASGEHLREAALADLFSVSRTPIRAALAANEKDGLLEYSQNRGYVVRPFDARDIVDAYEMRAMLEGFACRKVAERGLKLEAERNARRATDAVGVLLESGNPLDDTAREVWRRHNGTFHRAIIEHAENSFLPGMLQLVNRIPSVFPPILLTYDADALRVFNDQHTQILECILDRQGTRAEALMREHVYLACKTFCASIRNRLARDGTALPKRRLSQFPCEPACNQEYAGGLEQGLNDEAEPVVSQGEALVLQQPSVAALDRPAPLSEA